MESIKVSDGFYSEEVEILSKFLDSVEESLERKGFIKTSIDNTNLMIGPIQLPIDRVNKLFMKYYPENSFDCAEESGVTHYSRPLGKIVEDDDGGVHVLWVIGAYSPKYDETIIEE